MQFPLNAGALVSLPMTNADELLSLVTTMLTIAREVDIPSARKARARLEAAGAELGRLLGEQLKASGQPVAQGSRKAIDVAADRLWSAFEAWLDGWARIDDGDPLAARAEELYRVIFGAGLGFLTVRMPVQWAESQKRLDVLLAAEVRALVEALGGARFLQRLPVVHAEYGAAIGITRVAAPPPSPVRVAEAFEQARNTLRDYLAKVTASVEPDEPETEAAARRVLQPLMELRAGRAASGGASTPAAAPAQPGEPVPA